MASFLSTYIETRLHVTVRTLKYFAVIYPGRHYKAANQLQLKS